MDRAGPSARGERRAVQARVPDRAQPVEARPPRGRHICDRRRKGRPRRDRDAGANQGRWRPGSEDTARGRIRRRSVFAARAFAAGFPKGSNWPSLREWRWAPLTRELLLTREPTLLAQEGDHVVDPGAGL